MQAHETDGTTFQGALNYGPPPLAPAGDLCGMATLDPPPYVWLTVHAGAKNGPEYANPLVIPYTGKVPGTFQADISALTHGRAGMVWLTWNIGTGRSNAAAFDCVPAVATTTTTTPTAVCAGQLPACATTTTTTPTTTTTTTAPAAPVKHTTTTLAASPPPAALPRTGTATDALAGGGFALVLIGAALFAAARRR